MTQMTFSDLEYGAKRKQTRREKFLSEMDRVIPWVRLLALIEPVYPKGKNGRPPYPLQTMLRIHFMQQWFALSDPAMEEALYDNHSMRQFSGLSLSESRMPDETTILNFRRLLERHNLSARILAEINAVLDENGLLLKEGTIVDATIIAAPSSTKNKSGKRDPEMRQTKKGNNWHFGMKAHIGVDAESGLVHTVTTTSANEHDITQTHALLHGEETVVFGDAGYTGVEKREELQDVDVTWHIAMKPSQQKAIKGKRIQNTVAHIETLKASVRAKVEHPFRVIKRQFGFTKVRYKGLAKNTAQVLTLFTLSNLWMVRNKLMELTG
ncbi:IS5 family transposase [Orrella sp. 11846]|uniref:IS5 family transposase n=1 Tax=Orrella sp. 11846 TaxID=3409913 RepID=UPI003B58C5AD